MSDKGGLIRGVQLEAEKKCLIRGGLIRGVQLDAGKKCLIRGGPYKRGTTGGWKKMSDKRGTL